MIKSKYLLISLRVPHWVKNLFIFAALIFAQRLFVPEDLLKVLIAFILFSLVSSANYLINDIIDLPEDKEHPLKNRRPLASGKLPLWMAGTTIILLLGISIPFGFWLDKSFGWALSAYFLLGVSYSVFWKHLVILDVFAIAAGFILRVIAGGLVIHVFISGWLLLCTGLLSLFLGFSKRRHELILLGDAAPHHRKVLTEYSPYFLDQMISIVTAATLLTYILYTMNPVTIAKYGTDKLIVTMPFVLYGIFRYLYLVHQKKTGGSPAKLLLTDFPLLINIVLWIFTAVTIIYYH